MNFKLQKIVKRYAAKTHLLKLQKIQRHKHHHLIHHIHHVHNISKKTLFYVKEYGEHSNVYKTILKESIKIIIFASLISSLGGLALEHIKTVFISLMPLVILLPALNDMIGDYGAILSSRFSTMLHKGEVKKRWWTLEVKEMFVQVIVVALITAFLSATIALAVSKYYGTAVTLLFALKIFAITMTDVIVLVCVLFITSIYAGLHFFKKKEDPNNFLIPITTSIADVGNMVLLAVLIMLFF